MLSIMNSTLGCLMLFLIFGGTVTIGALFSIGKPKLSKHVETLTNSAFQVLVLQWSASHSQSVSEYLLSGTCPFLECLGLSH
jgi:hypothetical protein